MDMKRLFQQAVQDATSSAHGPASGSQGDDAPYGGSRRLKQRFEYGPNSKAAFVELHPSFMPTPEEFKAHLEAVPGVTKVDWQTTKTSQGNVGNHYCPQNLLVYSSTGPGSASPPIEFELTRNQHVKDQRVKPAVTAMFKDPPEGLIGEAWRILLGATKDKLLLPQHVWQYRKKHVLKWEGEEPVSDSDSGALAAGSPPSTKKKRGLTNPEPPVGKPIRLDASAPGFPAAASAAGAHAARSSPSPGAEGVGSTCASQAAGVDATSGSFRAAPAVVGAIAAPGPLTPADADAEPSGTGQISELAVLAKLMAVSDLQVHGDVGARPSSASQAAEEEAPGHSLEPPPEDSPAPPLPASVHGDVGARPSSASQAAEEEAPGHSLEPPPEDSPAPPLPASRDGADASLMHMDSDLLSERPGVHLVCLDEDAVNADAIDGTPVYTATSRKRWAMTPRATSWMASSRSRCARPCSLASCSPCGSA